MKRLYFILAVAGCMLASCDKYDDSALRKDMDDALSSLESRVEALESLTAEVEALTAIVEGKVTVASYVEKDGVYTVTLSDGKILKIQGEMSDVPVVTVISENGKNYWGYYSNGEVKPLLYSGNKVEVSTVMPGIRINARDHIEISVDGGKTWVESDTALSGGLFSKVEDAEDCLVLTLADGHTIFRVPFAEESQMQFAAFSGRQYFVYGESRIVSVEMVGVDNFTVTEKPEGWKAMLTEGSLTITAPAENAGETSGVIKMLGIGNDPMIAQVYVSIGTAPCTITISEDQNVTVTPSSLQCFYGASLLSEFNPKELVKQLSGVTNPMLSRYPYATTATTMPLTNLVSEVLEGETYVVWALPITGAAYTEADIIYEAVSSIGITHEVSEVTFEDAVLVVGTKGTDTYYLIPMQDDITLANVISDLNGSYAATYDRFKHTSTFRGLLSEVIEQPMAGQEYELLVLPVKFDEFLQADAKTFKVKLNDYSRGGAATVSLATEKRELQSVSVNVTASNYPYKVLTVVLTSEEYVSGGFADDEALLAYLSTMNPVQYSDAYVYEAKNLESDTPYWIVAVAMDRNGALGTPARLETSTRGIEYSTVTLELGSPDLTLNSALIPISASGEIVTYRYMCMSSSAGGYWYSLFIDDDAAAYDALIYGTVDYQEASASSVSEGIAFGELEFGTNYIFRVIGYDKEGRITNMAKLDFSPSVGKVISSADERWIAAKPAVSSVIRSNAIKLTVLFPNGCIQYSLTRMSSEEYSASMPGSARLKTDYVLGHHSVMQFTTNLSNYDPGWYISADKPYILIAWEDENGWYEPLVYDSATGQILN